NGAFPAISHVAGDFVRTVASVFGDKAAMAMNVTSTCPRSNINPSLGSQTWSEFVGSYLAAKFAEPECQNLDGIFLDNYVETSHMLNDSANSRARIDINNTNTASGLTDSEWINGMKALSAQIKSRIPSGRLILGNTGGYPINQGSVLNGGMIEGVDEYGANA